MGFRLEPSAPASGEELGVDGGEGVRTAYKGKKGKYSTHELRNVRYYYLDLLPVNFWPVRMFVWIINMTRLWFRASCYSLPRDGRFKTKLQQLVPVTPAQAKSRLTTASRSTADHRVFWYRRLVTHCHVPGHPWSMDTVSTSKNRPARRAGCEYASGGNHQSPPSILHALESSRLRRREIVVSSVYVHPYVCP